MTQFSVKMGLKACAKSIDPGQPAQSAQADPGRHFLLFVNFLHVHGLAYLGIHWVVKTESRTSWHFKKEARKGQHEYFQIV